MLSASFWSSAARRLAVLGAATLAACASGGGGSAPVPVPVPGAAGAAGTAPAAPSVAWPVRTHEHIDLWLHGLAMLMDDSARVPLFRRGYRDEVQGIRARANIATRLDAERARLRERFAVNGRLPLAAQFVPFAFGSWESLRRAIDLFLQTAGNPQRASDPASAQAIAFLAATFQSPADREWLRVFAGALDDEESRFYHNYWMTTQRDRSAALAAVESAWRSDLYPKLERFLSHTQQRGGELVLSLPLGGEGRTSGGSATQNVVAVNFPASAAAAPEALYAAVHEVVGSVAGPVVTDNTSPADQRAGLADQYTSAAQVRGGLILLQRTAPAFVDGYARYYLSVAGRPTPTGDPVAALAAAYPLPASLVDALAKQIEVTLGGI